MGQDPRHMPFGQFGGQYPYMMNGFGSQFQNPWFNSFMYNPMMQTQMPNLPMITPLPIQQSMQLG